MTSKPEPPEYTPVQTARAAYLLVRGAMAAMVGRDPAATKWDGKFARLAAKAREQGGNGES